MTKWEFSLTRQFQNWCTYMLDYVKVKTKDQDWRDAIKSTDITGFLIASLPPITRPKKRTLVEEIDGRDGDIITELGYSAYNKPLGIGMYGDYDFQTILDYFPHEGEIIFSNEPDKYYEFQIVDDINLERVIAFKKGVVNLHVQPYKYSVVDRAKTLNLMFLSLRDYKRTVSGVTTTIKDNKLTISGKADNLVELYIPLNIINIPEGSYKLVWGGKGTGSATVEAGVIKDTTSTIFGGELMKLNTQKTITVSGDTQTYNHLYIKIPTGTTVSLTAEPYIERTNVAMPIHNLGNVPSAPIIKIYGSGTINLIINGDPVCNINLPSQYDYIVLDARRRNAYHEDTFLNRYIICDFDNLMLPSGINTIGWTGNVSQVEIDEYSRWI